MGKELLFKALNHEKLDVVPWVPFAGVHAGKLKGYTAEEVLKDSRKLYESLIEVYKIYTPDGMPIVFDLQIEAEILGCELKWSKDNPPSVKTHPLAGENKKIPCKCKIPTPQSGRIPMILDVMRNVKKEIGDKTALYGLICGPLTLASHLRGSELFMDIMKDPDYATQLVAYCAEVCIKMTDYYADAGMDVIAVVDPLVSQVSPRHFKKVLSESFAAVFDYINSKNLYSSFFVCGNAKPQLKVMCETNPDSIAVDENVDMLQAKAVTDEFNIVLSGNIPLTTTMLYGNQLDNMKYVVDILDKINHTNTIISPGCDMPYDVPIENTIAVAQAVKQTEEAKEMVRNYNAIDEMDIDVQIPDYNNLEKPLVEVFTLDSETCAACTYMLASAVDVKNEVFGDKIDVVEYKYTRKEDIARTRKMGIKNLPTMCINGEVKWISLIPNRQELVDEINKYLK